jgi:mevalonate kinase
LNSKKLKKQFSANYEKFFSSCFRVASAPHSFIWSGDFSNFYGGISICSKIPLRFYVGLEKIDDDKFEVEEEFYAYNPSINKFERIVLDEYITSNLSNELSDIFKGYKVRFLSELILGLSLGGLGAMSAAIANLVHEDESKKSDFACKLVKKIQHGRSSAATALCALCDSALPIVVSSKNGKPWAIGSDKLFKIDQNVAWPFDFGLIFSGNLVQGGSVIASTEELQKESVANQREIEKITGYKTLSFWDSYLGMLEQVSTKTILLMKKLFIKGNSSENLKQFFSSLNHYQNLLHFVDISTPAIDKIYTSIHKIASLTQNNIGSGCKITGVGRGGEVLFALPFGQHREAVFSMAKNLGVSVDYASWQDGFEQFAGRIEQDLQRKVYSEFIRSDMYQIELVNKGYRTYKILSNRQINSSLIIDLVDNKIFIDGKKVDSKKIPSQKAACLIFEKLYQSENWSLDNEQLPKTYAASRFDLQSKIVTPLERYLGFKFEISGTSFEKFRLSLKILPTDVAIIRRIVD